MEADQQLWILHRKNYHRQNDSGLSFAHVKLGDCAWVVNEILRHNVLDFSYLHSLFDFKH